MPPRCVVELPVQKGHRTAWQMLRRVAHTAPLLPHPPPAARLRKSNFGAPRKGRTGALGAAAPSADPTATGGAHQQKGALHTCAAASWAAQGGGPSAEDAAQELVEKGEPLRI